MEQTPFVLLIWLSYCSIQTVLALAEQTAAAAAAALGGARENRIDVTASPDVVRSPPTSSPLTASALYAGPEESVVVEDQGGYSVGNSHVQELEVLIFTLMRVWITDSV